MPLRSDPPSPVWLGRVDAILWLGYVDSKSSSVSRPSDFGQSYLLSFKTELRGGEWEIGRAHV